MDRGSTLTRRRTLEGNLYDRQGQNSLKTEQQSVTFEVQSCLQPLGLRCKIIRSYFLSTTCNYLTDGFGGKKRRMNKQKNKNRRE